MIKMMLRTFLGWMMIGVILMGLESRGFGWDDEWEELDEESKMELELEKKAEWKVKQLKGKFLNLGGQYIYRFKPGYRLSDADLRLYLDYLMVDLKMKDLEAKVKDWLWGSMLNEMDEEGMVDDGFDLMTKITHSHLSKLIEFIQLGYRVSRFDEKSLVKNELKIPPLIEKREKKNISGSGDRKRFGHDLTYQFVNGSETKRDRLLQSMLGGLINPDPRVRLLSISVLRRLIPEVWTGRIMNALLKKRGRKVKKEGYYETVQKDAYAYLDFLRMKEKDIVFKEMRKLRQFIGRFILVNKIRGGGKETIEKMSPYIFGLISQPIDGESETRVPMNYFQTGSEIRSLIGGLNNKSRWVQRQCVESLLQVLRIQKTEYHLKLKIVEAILDSRYRGLILRSSNKKSLDEMSKKEVSEILKEYMRGKALIRRIEEGADDFYDSGDDLKLIQVSEYDEGLEMARKREIENETLNKGTKGEEGRITRNMIEREYLFE